MKNILLLLLTINCFSQNTNLVIEIGPGAKIYLSEQDNSNVVKSISQLTKAELLEVKDIFYKVKINEIIGYVKKYWISDNKNIIEIEKKIALEKLQEIEFKKNQIKIKREFDSINELEKNYKILKEETLLQNKKDNFIKKKYGNSILLKLKKRLIWIGMNKEMALYSAGNPKDINRTVTKNRVSEQWVYNNMYLYFENGILTYFQD
jgi:hypothetical protein